MQNFPEAPSPIFLSGCLPIIWVLLHSHRCCCTTAHFYSSTDASAAVVVVVDAILTKLEFSLVYMVTWAHTDTDCNRQRRRAIDILFYLDTWEGILRLLPCTWNFAQIKAKLLYIMHVAEKASAVDFSELSFKSHWLMVVDASQV